MSDLLKLALTAAAATFFLDLLDLAFARILFFIKTLRFLLYFILHLLITAVACALLYRSVSQWYIVGLGGSFLGVAVLSNSDVRIAGTNLLPIATLFRDIKAQMVAQAAEEKTKEILRKEEISLLTERLRRLPPTKLGSYCQSALVGAGWTIERIQKACADAENLGDDRDLALARLMINNNLDYVKKQITAWENPGAVGAPFPPDESQRAGS